MASKKNTNKTESKKDKQASAKKSTTNGAPKKAADKTNKSTASAASKKKSKANNNSASASKRNVVAYDSTLKASKAAKTRKQTKQRADENTDADELQKLTDQNNDLFREKETLRLELDDCRHEITVLQQTMEQSDAFREENDRLKLVVENYKADVLQMQTETIMLREALNESAAENEPTTNLANSKSSSSGSSASVIMHDQEKLTSVQNLLREKNEILTELDDFKYKYQRMEDEHMAMQRQLEEARKEVERLEQQLNGERNKYIEDSKRQENRINELTKKLEASQTELVADYERKEKQFIQTVEEQQKYIDELETDNKHLETQSTRRNDDAAAGSGMISLLKLNTQKNIFGGGAAAAGGHAMQYSGVTLTSGDLAAMNQGHHSQTSSQSSFDDDLDEEFSEYYNQDDDIASMAGGHSPYFAVHRAVPSMGNILTSAVSQIFDNFSLQGQERMDFGYGTPKAGDMSSYLEQMKHNQTQEQQRQMESKGRAERELREARERADKEKMDKEQEKVLAAQTRQSNLDATHLDEMKNMLKGKMEKLAANNSDGPIEQTSLNALGYFIDKNGRLLPVSEKKDDDGGGDGGAGGDDDDQKDKDNGRMLLSMSIDEYTYTQLQNAITVYIFDMMLKYYKFKPRQIGKQRSAANKNKASKAKSSVVQLDYKYKTLLFSANFNKAETVFVIIPPFRGGIAYWNLVLDKGIVYGSMLPYIEFGITVNDGKCGVLLLDPKGLDLNDTPYSIFKIYDKFLSKRVKNKKIKNIIFMGALNESNLISHLLDRRGNELKDCVRSCIFLCADDPYFVKPITTQIYQKCAVNYINSSLPMEDEEPGTKPNSDKFIIPRKSAGIAYFGVINAYPAVCKRVKQALAIQ